MKKIIRKFWNKAMHYFVEHVNIIDTFIINFLYLPIQQAIHFPIIVYNNTVIYDIKNITIEHFVGRGMIKIGVHQQKAKGKTRIIGGEFHFRGEAQIWGGCQVENTSIIEIGNRVALAENCTVMCKEKIVFEDFVHFGFNCTVMDTDFHYVLNTSNNSVKKATIPVRIMKGTWVSSDVKIMKGTVIPQNSIVVGGAVVNKNYEDINPETIFAGSPAKPIKTGFRRLYNVVVENETHKFFDSNKNEKILILDVNTDLDDFCYSNCLNFYLPD